MEDQPSILKLNEYCLMEIFSYFNLREVLTLEKVCPEFKNIAESFYQKQLELDINESDYYSINVNEVKKIALRVGPYLEILKIGHELFEVNSKVTKHLLTHCTNLQHLEIENCDIMAIIMALEETFKPLKTLKLNCCHLTDEIGPCLKAATHLKSLILTGNYEIQGSFLKDMKYLEEIDLQSCDKLSKANFLEFCEDNLTLKSLGISDRLRFTEEWLRAIVNGFKNLESIKIDHSIHNSANTSDLTILADLPKLIRLEVGSSGWLNFSSFLQSVSTRLECFEIRNGVSNDDIKSISKLEKLKELILYGITDKMLDILISQLRCKNVLEVLEIPFSSVSNDAVFKFVEKCPQLKKLILSFCGDITNDLIIRLVPVLNKRPQKIWMDIFWTRCQNSIHAELKSLGNSKIKLDSEIKTLIQVPEYYPDDRQFESDEESLVCYNSDCYNEYDSDTDCVVLHCDKRHVNY